MPSSSNPRPAGRRRFDASAVNGAIDVTLQALRDERSTPDAHPDGELLAACRAGAVLWQRQHAAFYGDTRIVDDDERDRLLEPLWALADPVLHRVYDLPATTLDGHRARAAILLAWDAGTLLGAAAADDLIEARLTLALAVDLLGSGS